MKKPSQNHHNRNQFEQTSAIKPFVDIGPHPRAYHAVNGFCRMSRNTISPEKAKVRVKYPPNNFLSGQINPKQFHFLRVRAPGQPEEMFCGKKGHHVIPPVRRSNNFCFLSTQCFQAGGQPFPHVHTEVLVPFGGKAPFSPRWVHSKQIRKSGKKMLGGSSIVDPPKVEIQRFLQVLHNLICVMWFSYPCWLSAMCSQKKEKKETL